MLSLLLLCELAFERLGHLGRWGSGQAEVDLDRVVDEPLQGGQCTDHDDPGAKSLPHSCHKQFIQSVFINLHILKHYLKKCLFGIVACGCLDPGGKEAIFKKKNLKFNSINISKK